MIETDFQKRLLAGRRDRRDRERDGWEYLGEGSRILGEISRGNRIGQRITEVAIANDGRGLWIKTTTERRP